MKRIIIKSVGSRVKGQGDAHHVVSWEELLQKLRLFMLHRLDDERVVAGEIEPGATSPGIGQLDQRLFAYGVLRNDNNTHIRV